MFEHALEDCLTRMRLEGVTPEECLAQYPQFRLELAPLLAAAQDLGHLETLEPRPLFRSQARAKLFAHMHATPRRHSNWYATMAFRYAASLALLFVALTATGTALAQNALPGDTLYGWKLASERVWYNLQGKSVETDAYLTGRRVSEILAIKGHGNLEEIGVGAYTEVLEQLSADLANDPEKADSISELLRRQKEQLEEIFANSHGHLPDLDELFNIVVFPPANEHANPPAQPEGNHGGQLPLIVTATSFTKPEGKKETQEPKASGHGPMSEGSSSN